MDKVLNKSTVVELLEKAVAQKGADYIDPAAADPMGECRYADEQGNPMCIVGHVFNYMGQDLSPVEEELWDGSPYTKLWGDGESARSALPYVSFTVEDVEAVETALYVAQEVQDGGKTWGEALVAAKEAIGVGSD